MIDKWSNLPEEEHIALNSNMSDYTLNVILTVLFGDQFNNEADILSFKKAYDVVSLFLLIF